MSRPAGSPVTVLYAAWAPFFSGAERALMMLLDHLDRTRYRPVVALGTRGELERELTARGIPCLHIPVVYGGLSTAVPWLVSVSKLARLCRRADVRLVHANDAPSFQPAGYAARWLGLPSVVHVRFPDSAAGYRWFLKPGFNRAVFVSETFRADEVAKAPDLFAGRNVAIHDAVREAEFLSPSARLDLRDELALPHDRTVVGIVGQVAEVKGIFEFIGAAAVLLSRGVRATFVVLGDDLKGQGALRRTLEADVASRGLTEHVRFLGFRQDAPRLMGAFDVVVAPSHVEPLGLSPLEAMAAGLPVVGSRVGGIQETVVDGVTGFLVPPQDTAALADAVAALVNDPARAQAMGMAGRVRAMKHFSPLVHADRVQAQYDDMLR